MDATVRIPEAYGTVFAATEDIIAVGVEPRGEDATFVTFQHVHLLLRKIFHTHSFFYVFATERQREGELGKQKAQCMNGPDLSHWATFI